MPFAGRVVGMHSGLNTGGRLLAEPDADSDSVGINGVGSIPPPPPHRTPNAAKIIAIIVTAAAWRRSLMGL